MPNLQYPPAGWTSTQVEKFNALISAIECYELYASALARLGVADPILVQRRNELGDHIRTVLGPDFRNA